MAIKGAADTEVFQTYVREVLAPTLRTGDIVVMDNLQAHKNEETLALLASAGAQALFLPAYSPNFNPIEKMWSKIKQVLRSLEARTHDTLIEAIAKAFSKVSANDCFGWFVSCGYRFI